MTPADLLAERICARAVKPKTALSAIISATAAHAGSPGMPIAATLSLMNAGAGTDPRPVVQIRT